MNEIPGGNGGEPKVPNMDVIKGLLAIVFGIVALLFAYKIIVIIVGILLLVVGLLLLYYGVEVLQLTWITRSVDEIVRKIRSLLRV